MENCQGLVLCGFIFVSGFYLLAEHTAHLCRLATAGIYARVRHPQCVGFIIIMFGFLIQWPTILTLLMFPALVGLYIDRAHTEEAEASAKFGAPYSRYAADVPGWFPHIRRFAEHGMT